MMDTNWCKQYPVYRIDDARVLKLCDGCDHKNICAFTNDAIDKLTLLKQQLTCTDCFRFVGTVADDLPSDTNMYRAGDFILVKRQMKSSDGEQTYTLADPYVYSGDTWLHLFHDLGIIPTKGNNEYDNNDRRNV